MRSITLSLLLAAVAFGGLTFIKNPQMTKVANSNNWTITFQLSASSDVEVSVVKVKDSTVVRHLAAGRIGAAAPAPLVSGTLDQQLTWDGKDDLGTQVVNPESLSVRVRAGMSIALNKTTAHDPYQIGQQVNGIATDEAGNAYVFSTTGTLGTTTLRKYDAVGNYLNTVYPFPGNLPKASVIGYGINEWESGNWYSPKTMGSSGLEITSTLVGGYKNWLSERIVNNNAILYCHPSGWPTTALTQQEVSIKGEMIGQKSIVATPALPTSASNICGDAILATVSGKDYYYLSGIYEGTAANKAIPLASSFWMDGKIFRVNPATRVATAWLTVDSVPMDASSRQLALGNLYGNMATTLRGVTTDTEGHVFVCDRLRKRVAVYDTNAVFLGAISVNFPELVAVNNKTGEVYVLTKYLDNSGYPKAQVSLYKFSGWKPGYTLVDSLQNFMTNVGEAFGASRRSRIYMSLVQSATTPAIWCAGGNNVWTVLDEGANLRISFNFGSRAQKTVPGYDRLAVDRKTETVYINDGWAGLSKITDWNNPVPRPCSTSLRQRLYAGDMSISPRGQLYLRENNAYSGPVTRYTLDNKHVPVPFANSGKNVLTPYIYGRMGEGYGDKGLGVAPDNRVAVAYMGSWNDFFVGVFGDSAGPSGDTASYTNRVLTGMTDGSFGCSPRYDLAGNLYVAIAHLPPPNYVFPSVFKADVNYQTGAVIKIPAGTPAPCTLNAAKQFSSANVSTYSLPISPFVRVGSCVCRSPRFEVDPYGRLFLPDAYHNRVRIIDNAGGLINEFGHYGNNDSWGANSPVPEVDIPLAFPLAVAASNDYIYVNDMVNNRLVRVQMNYELDNIPGLTAHNVKAEKVNGDKFVLSVSPNPFNPVTEIKFKAVSSAKGSVAVFDAQGRLIEKIHDGRMVQGSNVYKWNGGAHSAGMYLVRVTVGNKTFTQRIILAK
ncbi:MAG: T9SS type A sorting domain-containing protein [Fibrobacteres bacterium]|nr:T9SS type A sorting domain-containing protein [Fibrobacterota bacterium]